MKDKKGNGASFTQPLLKDLIARQKVDSKITLDKMTGKSDIGSTPLQQPALYQDPGSGYNADFEFPQD